MLANVARRDLAPAEIVARYAAAKSRQDVAGALAVCTDDFVLDTVAFGIRGVGTAEVAAHLGLFFATFPDYRVTMDGQAVADDDRAVTCWGTFRATMRGALGTFGPTNAACTVPFVCVFELGGDRLAAERFFFDLGTMCEQLGLPLDGVATELRAFRAAQPAPLAPERLWTRPERAADAPPPSTDARPASADARPPAADADDRADFVARFIRFWRPPVDLDDLASLLHPDVRLIAPGMPPTTGRDAGIAAFRQVFAMVPDLHIDVERWSATGDAVFIECTMRGTLAGHRLEIPSVDRILVRDGVVLERVAYFDPSPMLAAASAAA